jgi:hypothetical protein
VKPKEKEIDFLPIEITNKKLLPTARVSLRVARTMKLRLNGTVSTRKPMHLS